MDNRDYWLWITNINNITSNKIKKILDYFGDPLSFYKASDKALKSFKGIKEKDIEIIINSKKEFDMGREFDLLERKHIAFICPDDKEYPEQLLMIEEIPYSLYVKGKLPKNNYKIGIIGARECSNYGRVISKNMAKELGSRGIDIISGMARGIDTYGHIGAMEGGGDTYAVLGCGVDICYPSENIELYDEIIKKGGIISEYPPGTRPDGWRFPKRNRIISGLSDGIVLVEAKDKSGSLITAEYALDQGKEVFAVPGRVCDELSRGCNRLIREGALPVIEVKDILFSFGIEDNRKIKNNENLNIVLEKDFEVLYSDVDLLPVSIEELVMKTGFEFGKVYEILLELQMMGLVYEPVKNYYARNV